MTVRFSNQLVPELYQPFWAAWQSGEFLTDAAAVAGAEWTLWDYEDANGLTHQARVPSAG